MEYFFSNLQLQMPGGNDIYIFLKKVKRGRGELNEKNLGTTDLK